MHWLYFTLLLLLYIPAFGQNQNLSYTFVKPETTLHDNKPSCFNSLKIINHSEKLISIKTELFVPKGWQVAPFMKLPQTIDIPATYQGKFLPAKKKSVKLPLALFLNLIPIYKVMLKKTTTIIQSANAKTII